MLKKLQSLDTGTKWKIALTFSVLVFMTVLTGWLSLQKFLAASSQKQTERAKSQVSTSPDRAIQETFQDAKKTFLPALGSLTDAIKELTKEAPK